MYDAIVIGTGGIGSAALYHLALRGLRVLGLDRFAGGHDRGSSHGQTRMIRQAYFEHPDYVPLVLRAYELWAELEDAIGQQLLHQVGLLEVGPPGGVVLPGVMASAQQHGLEVERLTTPEAAKRFPGLHVPDDMQAVFELRAGYLLVEQCVLAHLQLAQRSGAELRTDVSVRKWHAGDKGVRVETDDEVFLADRLVVTAGAWSGQLLAGLGMPLTVLRKHMHWFDCDDVRYRAEKGCPAFFYELPEGYFYGFPQIDPLGVKVAEHGGGEIVNDPLAVSREVDLVDRRRVAGFLKNYLPGVSARSTHHTVCMYTMTPDEHFVVDRHPQYANTVFAAGLSGHGFKFAPALGEILADLCTSETGRETRAMFRSTRFRRAGNED